MLPSQLKFDAQGLVAVVVQDRLSGEVRMLAHANEAAVRATLETREGHFFSRSRQALWRKGETSGHVLHVTEIWADCDADALIYLVDPEGPSCHTGRDTCFFQPITHDGAALASSPDARPLLARLAAELEARTSASAETSYTRSLLDAGTRAIGAKIREEADELACALESESDARVLSEAADELFHMMVGLLARGLSLRDVEGVLAKRLGQSGLAEKASRGSRTDQ
jgi:phosphoribosyl-ATP pyrophosphohydrolase/phosphoribosyl-AMP cyclohydrolase